MADAACCNDRNNVTVHIDDVAKVEAEQPATAAVSGKKKLAMQWKKLSVAVEVALTTLFLGVDSGMQVENEDGETRSWAKGGLLLLSGRSRRGS